MTQHFITQARKGARRSRHAQRGMTILNVALSLVAAVAVSALAVQRYGEVSVGVQNNAAFEEVSRWHGEMMTMGVVRSHVYTGLTQANLLAETSIDDATNVFGEAITVAVVGTDWAMTYSFPTAESCEYVEQRVLNLPGLSAVPACNATNQLVVTVE